MEKNLQNWPFNKLKILTVPSFWAPVPPPDWGKLRVAVAAAPKDLSSEHIYLGWRWCRGKNILPSTKYLMKHISSCSTRKFIKGSYQFLNRLSIKKQNS